MVERPTMRPKEIQEVLEDLGVYPLFPSPEEARRELTTIDPRKQDIFNALRKGDLTLAEARERMRQLKIADG